MSGLDRYGGRARSRSRERGGGGVRPVPTKVKVRRMLGPFGGQAQSEVVVTANVFQTEVPFPDTTTPFTRFADINGMDPQNFTTMSPPRIALGSGSNSLNQNGVWMAFASFTSNLSDPFHRNFVGFKIDHPGWNCCNPRQWNANVTQFAYVKSSPVVLEITLPDPPISKALPVTVFRPPVFRSAADLTSYQTANMGVGVPSDGVPIWNETRPTGAWQYIILPAQKGASLNLSKIVGYLEWQQLLQIGYKPQTCRGKTYKCVCAAKGADSAEQNSIFGKLASLAVPPPGTIPPFNQPTQGTGPGQYNTVHKAQETDWCVQYSAGPYADNFASAQQQAATMIQQGFDVLAFGSGIVFQFVQYAPPCMDGTATVMKQILPLTLTVHSKTTFRQLKSASQDLGQVSTLPIVGGV